MSDLGYGLGAFLAGLAQQGGEAYLAKKNKMEDVALQEKQRAEDAQKQREYLKLNADLQGGLAKEAFNRTHQEFLDKLARIKAHAMTLPPGELRDRLLAESEGASDPGWKPENDHTYQKGMLDVNTQNAQAESIFKQISTLQEQLTNIGIDAKRDNEKKLIQTRINSLYDQLRTIPIYSKFDFNPPDTGYSRGGSPLGPFGETNPNYGRPYEKSGSGGLGGFLENLQRMHGVYVPPDIKIGAGAKFGTFGDENSSGFKPEWEIPYQEWLKKMEGKDSPTQRAHYAKWKMENQ